MTEKQQGLSLLDIKLATELVEVAPEQKVEVRGISSSDILTLIQRFPDMQKFVSIGGIKATDIMNLAPTTVSGIIAAGVGHVGDAEYEAFADKLSIEAQLNMLEAIGRCTFRSGFGPFVMRISAHVVAALSGSSGRATGTNSLPQSKT
jgi:hypothetical protein